MYKSIHIQNFRGLRDLQINDLGRVNLIVGANNVGKTSVLEAMWLLHSAGDPFTLVELATMRGLPIGRPSVEMLVDGLSHGLRWEAAVRVEGKRADGFRNALAISTPEVERDEDELPIVRSYHWSYKEHRAPTGLEIDLAFSSDDPKIAARKNTRSRSVDPTSYQWRSEAREDNPFGPGIAVSASNRLTNDELALRLTEAQDVGGRSDLLLALQELDPLVEDVYLGVDRSVGYASRTIPVAKVKYRLVDSPLPLELVGGGAGRLLEILVSVPVARQGVMVVDEVENGIYHEHLVNTWRALDVASEGTAAQVFATTHSWECVNAAVRAFSSSPGDFRIHRLERHDRIVRVITYDYELAEVAVEDRVEVR
jgi:hypothetical protein